MYQLSQWYNWLTRFATPGVGERTCVAIVFPKPLNLRLRGNDPHQLLSGTS